MGVRTEAGNPEGSYDPEGRFHAHLEHGGNGEQGDAAREAAFGEIVIGAAQRFANGPPGAGHGLYMLLHGECPFPGDKALPASLFLGENPRGSVELARARRGFREPTGLR
jgi:hypothetical protein